MGYIFEGNASLARSLLLATVLSWKMLHSDLVSFVVKTQSCHCVGVLRKRRERNGRLEG